MAVPDAAPYLTVLGIDPGTLTGVALAHVPIGSTTVDPTRLHLDLWNLSCGPFDSGALRLVRLRHRLAEVRPSFVAFERPVHSAGHGSKAGNSQRTVEALGAFIGVVACWCEEQGVPCVGIPVASIKKEATGKGNAKKDAVVQAAIDRFGVTLDPQRDRDTNRQQKAAPL